MLKRVARGAAELMQDACDRLQSLENAAFMKKTTQRRKGAKTQRKRISRRDPAVWS